MNILKSKVQLRNYKMLGVSKEKWKWHYFTKQILCTWNHTTCVWVWNLCKKVMYNFSVKFKKKNKLSYKYKKNSCRDIEFKWWLSTGTELNKLSNNINQTT